MSEGKKSASKTFAQLVREAMREALPAMMPAGWPDVDTIRVRPFDSGPTEYACHVTYGPQSFSMFGEYKTGTKRKALTPKQVADKIVERMAQRDDGVRRHAAAEAARVRALEREQAALAEVPNAVGTVLEAHPAIGVMGIGQLRIVGIKDDPTEPVFLITGEFTVAAVKQLCAGTLFHLSCDRHNRVVSLDETAPQLSQGK